MGKKSKKQESNGAAEAEEAPQAKKRSKPAAKKTSAKTGAKKTRKPAVKGTGYEPSDDEIRIRAYFIAERRAQLSMPGDPANDWIEARRQLLEEAEQRRLKTSVPV